MEPSLPRQQHQQQPGGASLPPLLLLLLRPHLLQLLLLVAWSLPARTEATAARGSATLVQEYTTYRPSVTTEMVYQSFAIEPMDQTAVIGSRVTLPCRVLNQKGPIQWTKDDFGLGSGRNMSGYDRYTMIGSDEEGKIFLYFISI